MKTTDLLQSLAQLLVQLRTRAAPLAQQATLSARFDRQLFSTRSTLLQDCLDEAGDNLQHLQQAVEHRHSEQVIWLAERLSHQLTAIAREIDAWPLRVWDNASPGVMKWQRKRVQHQEFEQRLLQMVKEREQRLSQVTRLDEQQQLQRELIAFEGRLKRCRHALANIENVLGRLTR